jgi:hypothetical protein
VEFERGSRLNRIAERAFSECVLLSCICLPASVEVIADSAFPLTTRVLREIDHSDE